MTSTDSQPQIVLIVDDDPAVRGALKFALEAEGFEVRAYAGPAALLDDDSLPPEGCLVIDYRMPVIDGLELVSRLRERGVAIPAIMITGRNSKYLEAQAAKMGVHQVLEKPLPNGSLVAAIRSAMTARH